MATEKIVSRAPTRVDLAGGTVDIWPLYLMLDRPSTINLGIDLFAECTLETSGGAPGIVLESKDQNARMELGWDALEGATAPGTLELPLKLLRHFYARRMSPERQRDARATRVTIHTSAKSPAGAGLGGSSTLCVAINGALEQFTNGRLDVEKDGESLIQVACDTECTVIQVPAGLQDYYGAMFGGLQNLHWRAHRHERARLPESTLRDLESRVLLFYSGQSRNSGINNWALFKGFIDKSEQVRSQFAGIVDATKRLEKALQSRDWRAVGEAIAAEWSVRRTLAPGISTPEIDRAFAAGLEEGATAGKICGAGGGGCFFLYVPSGDAALRKKIEERIVREGAGHIRALPFKAVPHGLEVTVSRGA